MDKNKLILECAEMLENYYKRFSGKYNSHKVYSLDSGDMDSWKKIYYPELQKYPEIHDADFFQPTNEKKNPNYGVGADGTFTLYEYCNIRYQLYRFLVLRLMDVMDMELPKVEGFSITVLLEILEGYVPQFAHKGTADAQTVRFCEQHKKIWDNFYALNESECLIADGAFFGNIQANPNYGIGKDGEFYGAELLHFLGNCYKTILDLLNA